MSDSDSSDSDSCASPLVPLLPNKPPLANLPPLALLTLPGANNASILSTTTSTRLQLDPLSLTKRHAMSQNADTALASSPRTAKGFLVGDDERFAKMFSQKRTVAGYVAPSSKRIDNESLVPPPPVVVAPLVGENSREEKHERNVQRIFGSSEARNRQYAGGLSTYVRPTQSTIRCDTQPIPTPQQLQQQHYPPATLGMVLPQQKFVDLRHFEGAQRLIMSPYNNPPGTANGWNGGQTSMSMRDMLPTPPSTARQLESRNQFFFATRTPRAGGAVTMPIPEAHKMHNSPARKSRNTTQPSAGAIDSPTASDDENLAFVNTETKRFDMKQSKRKQATALLVESTDDLLTSTAESRAADHTSDLLKMIFHGRIAMDCEATHLLQDIAAEKGTEAFVGDVSAAAQRVGFRTSNVDEFHLFLCGFLRDPDLSYSESRVIFQAIDANNSGVIDVPELLEGMRLLLLSETELILTYGRRLFTEPSKYKDARLSYLEVQAIFLAGLEFYECDISNATALTDPPKAELLKGQRQGGRKYNANRKDGGGSPTRTGGGDSLEGSLKEHSLKEKIAQQQQQQAPAMEKPSIESIKRRLVSESTRVLVEAWKTSNSGLVAASLLRTLMNGMGQTLFAAISSIPHHFQLSKSTFLKETLTKDSARYDSYLAQNNLDLDHMEARNDAQLGSRKGSRGKMKGRFPTPPTAAAAKTTAIAGATAKGPPSPVHKHSQPASPKYNSNSNNNHNNSSSRSSRLGSTEEKGPLVVVPISYEEYEEANGEVNVEALANQLRDPTLKLSQTQRANIAKQIIVQQQQRKTVAVGGGTGGGGGGNANNNNQRRRSERSGSKIAISQSDDFSNSTTTMTNASKMKSKRQSMRKLQEWIPDLDEIVDAYHPRFQADLCRVGNLQRQLGAPEHLKSEFVSRQGHVFVKAGEGGQFRPLAGDFGK